MRFPSMTHTKRVHHFLRIETKMEKTLKGGNEKEDKRGKEEKPFSTKKMPKRKKGLHRKTRGRFSLNSPKTFYINESY